jgi:DNA-binding response OmpR family regulator
MSIVELAPIPLGEHHATIAYYSDLPRFMNPIYFIEDDAYLAGLLSTKLKIANISVRWFSTAETALEALSSGEIPSAFIVDILLPGMSGLKLVTDIRSRPELAKVPILILTNIDDAEARQTSHDLGVTRYVVKSDTSPEGVVTLAQDLIAQEKPPTAKNGESVQGS